MQNTWLFFFLLVYVTLTQIYQLYLKVCFVYFNIYLVIDKQTWIKMHNISFHHIFTPVPIQAQLYISQVWHQPIIFDQE